MLSDREDFFLFRDEAIKLVDRAIAKLDSLLKFHKSSSLKRTKRKREVPKKGKKQEEISSGRTFSYKVGISESEKSAEGQGEESETQNVEVENIEEIIYDIYSDIHTVKGESGFFGLFDVAESLHYVEDELLKMKNLKTIDEKVFDDIKSRLVFVRTRIRACEQYNLSSISDLVEQINRFFSEYARVLGKKSELKISVQTGITDENLIKDIMHIVVNLIRNSLEHGIEMSEERVSKGKAEVGQVGISIFERKNHDTFLVLEYTDDGKGFDRYIIEKIKKEGFESVRGLSSKKTPTIHSGRGIGLYSIYKTALKYSGNISVENRQDVEGAKIVINLKIG